jgi:hypothetical protein
MTAPLPPTCWKFEPGVILALERTLHPPTAADVWLSPAEPAVYFPSSGVVLRRYCTPPGDELRVLVELTTRSNVLSASLNYLGSTAAAPHTDAPPADTVSVAPPESSRYVIGVSAKKTESDSLFDPENGYCLQLPKTHKGIRIALIIDVDEGHAKCVAYQLTGRYAELTDGAFCRYITLTTDADKGSSADLATFCRLLLAGGEVQARVEVVNLSVDLGQLCDPEGGCNTPEVAQLYSFPFFEACLDEFRSARRRQGDVPVLVAAAGNRGASRKGVPADLRWRLGYPASLPDVVAVTCLRRDGSDTSAAVDCPAVGPLKPCFAEPVLDFRKPLADSPWARHPESTSYASGAFAGRVMAFAQASWEEGQPSPHGSKIVGTGSFGKVASLVGRSTPKLIGGNDPKRWVPPVVRCLDPKLPPCRSGPFAQLLRELFQDTGREFVLTGSAAFVEAWLVHHEFNLKEEGFDKILSWIGDLDFLHTGGSLDDPMRLQVRATVNRWGEGRGRSGVGASDLALTAHALRTWAGALYLFQCVIPDAQFLATAGGVIDPWASHPLKSECRLPRLYLPPRLVWKLNPQNRTGIAGLADGILVYLNRLMLEVLLATLVQPFQPPDWLGLPVPNEIDRLVREAGGAGPDDWYGVGRRKKRGAQPVPADHLERRMKRSAELRSQLSGVTTGNAASERNVKLLVKAVDQYEKSFLAYQVPHDGGG